MRKMVGKVYYSHKSWSCYFPLPFSSNQTMKGRILKFSVLFPSFPFQTKLKGMRKSSQTAFWHYIFYFLDTSVVVCESTILVSRCQNVVSVALLKLKSNLEGVLKTPQFHEPSGNPSKLQHWNLVAVIDPILKQSRRAPSWEYEP